MNYKESKKILEEIKKANRILLNCHKYPDPDSISSALATYRVLKKMGKDVKVFCSTKIPKKINFLPDFKVIEEKDFVEVSRDIDLFIILDTSDWAFATNTLKKPDNIKLIVIDHHRSNTLFGDLNLVQKDVQSNCEILYLLFNDWKIKIDKDTAKCLLTGIVSDTGVFRFPGTTARTLVISSKLMSLGVNLQDVLFPLFYSITLKNMKFWGYVLSNIVVDNNGKFAWVAVPHDEYLNYGGEEYLKESTASNFFQSIEGTDFGIVIVEQQKGKINISLRSRTGIDMSKLAILLNGGGHRYAAGASINDLSFDKAVKIVLQVARKYAKNNQKKIN